MVSSEIPELYKKGLVWLEDRSFYDNNGVSFRGIVRSIVHDIAAGHAVEGASTLSAQFIRNALWLGEDRSLSHKVLEFLYAIRLNHLFTKEQILTMYADRISFGHMNYGLKSASLYYFAKEPNNLTEAEQIALLAIPKNPASYDPYTQEKSFQKRFEMIVKTLQEGKIITELGAKNILSEEFAFNTDHRDSMPYVADFIKKNT